MSHGSFLTAPVLHGWLQTFAIGSLIGIGWVWTILTARRSARRAERRELIRELSEGVRRSVRLAVELRIGAMDTRDQAVRIEILTSEIVDTMRLARELEHIEAVPYGSLDQQITNYFNAMIPRPLPGQTEIQPTDERNLADITGAARVLIRDANRAFFDRYYS